ncbi:DUF7674 family protein [Kitasatospora camelliae]|uniref:DUF7674 domain-containing protein n=1 Tax=Kitasatospora camelliae TaxID=3156397 RepID=A0AAU8K731_9ACTN
MVGGTGRRQHGLADADRAEVERWRGPAEEAEAEAEDDVPPLTLRLGHLATTFTEHTEQFTPEQIRQLFRLLEEIQVQGSEEDGTAVATGFFEALLNAGDEGFDLDLVRLAMGPESRAHCRAWNDFTGTTGPAWMH